MFWSSETAYEQVRERQRELREQARRAQLVARARRETSRARSGPGPFSRAARRLRAAIERP